MSLGSLLADDLASIASDTALNARVTVGTRRGRAIGPLRWEEVPEPDASGGFVLVRRRTLVVRAVEFDGLTLAGSLITVDDDTDLRVREVRHISVDLVRLILA